MENRIRSLVLLGFWLLLAQVDAAAENLNNTVIDRLSNSIVKIFATSPAGKEVVASGFFYRDNESIITSLHVVAGARRIQVKLSSGGGLISAKIQRVINDQDLALLELVQPVDRLPLTTSMTPSIRGEKLICLGYPFNIPSIDDTSLVVKSTNKRLRDIVPPSVKKGLDEIGFPSTNSSIMNLDGHLLPGHSGAPIFNDQGLIVAIANGGLAVGAASRSWAIKASYLAVLLTSDETVPSTSVTNSDLFAEELSPAASSNTIGDGLVFIRHASIIELLNTTDDPQGLQLFASTFTNIDPARIGYRIYRERSSGATLVVPDTMDEPTLVDNLWQTSAPDGLVSLNFRIEKVNEFNTQQRSLEFERDLVAFDDIYMWQADPNWTYPFPRPTLDGMRVRRLAYLKLQQTMMGLRQLKQIIVTFSSNGSVLLSAAAKLNNNDALFSAQANQDAWFTGSTAAFLTTLSN